METNPGCRRRGHRAAVDCIAEYGTSHHHPSSLRLFWREKKTSNYLYYVQIPNQLHFFSKIGDFLH
jgi:hypothetical protein